MSTRIVLAGATGNLGKRIARELRKRDADVVAVVRRSSDHGKLEQLRRLGVTVAEVDFGDVDEVARACKGTACVVSALSGLRGTIVDTQKVLLDGAIKAGVPRFIPSDYSLDFTQLPTGTNRNLDLRRDFHRLLDAAPLKATSIYVGAFSDMLTGQMPLILFKPRRVLFFGDANQPLDFTTMDDTAAYTAAAALDPSTPRALHIAGDRLSARDLVDTATEVTGQRFKLFRAGGLGVLSGLIKVARTVAPGQGQLYPAWQGMQYMSNMFDGRGAVSPLNNDRYPDVGWLKVRDVLASHLAPR